MKISTVDSTQLPHLTNLAATADGRLCSESHPVHSAFGHTAGRSASRLTQKSQLTAVVHGGSKARSNFELANGRWASDRSLLHGGPLRAP